MAGLLDAAQGERQQYRRGFAPGTVGEYLQGRPLRNKWRRVCDTALLIAVCCWMAAFLIWAFKGVFALDVGNVISAESVDLSGMVPFLIAIGSVLAILALILWILIARKRPKADPSALIKRALLAFLAQKNISRFGMTLDSQMSDVGLHVRPLVRTRGVYAARMSGMDLLETDFVGLMPRDMGAFDFLVRDGRLYVFLSEQSKDDFIARVVRIHVL